jgi:D-psicose/D-tagatose/L-ribulose 3-epimerase
MTAARTERLPIALACHANILVAEASPRTLPAALDTIAELGYSHVVLPPMDPAATNVAALGRMISERGLAPITMVGGLSPATDVGSPDADVREAGAEILRSVIDFTAELGGDQVNGVPYGMFGHPAGATTADAFARSARQVGLAADYAHERGIAMTFEVLNRYETSVVNTAAQAMEFVALSGSEHLRIHLDTFHMAIEEADMGEAIRRALPRLGYLELGQSGRESSTSPRSFGSHSRRGTPGVSASRRSRAASCRRVWATCSRSGATRIPPERSSPRTPRGSSSAGST